MVATGWFINGDNGVELLMVGVWRLTMDMEIDGGLHGFSCGERRDYLKEDGHTVLHRVKVPQKKKKIKTKLPAS